MTGKTPTTIKIAGLVALTLVGACSTGSQSKPNLAGACQMTKCVCAGKTTMFWQAPDTVPIVWQRNGDASCPAGYTLVRGDDDKKKR